MKEEARWYRINVIISTFNDIDMPSATPSYEVTGPYQGKHSFYANYMLLMLKRRVVNSRKIRYYF